MPTKKDSWSAYTQQMDALLQGLSFRDARGRELDPARGFALWRRLALDVRASKGTIYLVGNGASASMASHFAADLAKNGKLHTQVFSDLSLITAISNDMGYEHVFAEPLRRRGQRGDMLVAISSSGQSPNVLAAVQIARRLKMNVVSLSAMKPGNTLRQSGNLNAYVAATTYGHAETCHAAILHHWMDIVETRNATRPR